MKTNDIKYLSVEELNAKLKELNKIISETTTEQLGISINQAVENDNYRILGDIKVAYIKDKVLYIALMVKEDNKNNKNKKEKN